MEKQELEKQFREKYHRNSHYYYSYCEDGVGAFDVKRFPDTPLHRKLYPELYEFKFFHYCCYLKRGGSLCWCGYVETELHPCWKNDDNTKHVQVHGGITYANSITTIIGFDCAHAYDIQPFSTCYPAIAIYRTHDFAKGQLKSLCEQLYTRLPPWSPATHRYFPTSLKKRYLELFFIWFLRHESSDLKNVSAHGIWISIINCAINLEFADEQRMTQDTPPPFQFREK